MRATSSSSLSFGCVLCVCTRRIARTSARVRRGTMGRDEDLYKRKNEHSGAVGGAEAHARWRQYSYDANASLVLTSEKSGGAGLSFLLCTQSSKTKL